MSLIEMSHLTERQREKHHKAFVKYNLAYKEYKVAYKRANSAYWPNLKPEERRKISRDLIKYLEKFERARDNYFALCTRYGVERGKLQDYYY